MARLKEFDPEERLIKARNLFWQKGFNATSMEELVQAMDLRRKSIYDTFGDKHQLFVKCLENYLAYVTKDNEQAAAGVKSPVKAIEKILERTIRRSFESGYACMAVKSSFEMGQSDGEVNSMLSSAFNKSIEKFTQLLTTAKQLGEISENSDPGALACIIQSALSGIGQDYALFNDSKHARRISDQLISALR